MSSPVLPDALLGKIIDFLPAMDVEELFLCSEKALQLRGMPIKRWMRHAPTDNVEWLCQGAMRSLERRAVSFGLKFAQITGMALVHAEMIVPQQKANPALHKSVGRIIDTTKKLTELYIQIERLPRPLLPTGRHAAALWISTVVPTDLYESALRAIARLDSVVKQLSVEPEQFEPLAIACLLSVGHRSVLDVVPDHLRAPSQEWEHRIHEVAVHPSVADLVWLMLRCLQEPVDTNEWLMCEAKCALNKGISPIARALAVIHVSLPEKTAEGLAVLILSSLRYWIDDDRVTISDSFMRDVQYCIVCLMTMNY